MTFNPDRHHRRSIRLPDYDYSRPGAYFVTICSHQREYIFGAVRDGAIFLSQAGEIVEQCWSALSNHFVFIELDARVVMPNHVHGIIVIKDYGQGNFAASSGTKPRSLASIIQNFKSVSARKVNQLSKNGGAPVWQRGYYERVIRNEAELDHIRRYIVSNPGRWKNIP